MSARPQLRKAVEQLFPPLPALSPDPPTVPGPDGHPLALADLQRLALSNNPTIRQAAADVVSAQGAALQAGVYPNPTIGYQGDTMGTTGGAGYQGFMFDQKIMTAPYARWPCVRRERLPSANEAELNL